MIVDNDGVQVIWITPRVRQAVIGDFVQALNFPQPNANQVIGALFRDHFEQADRSWCGQGCVLECWFCLDRWA